MESPEIVVIFIASFVALLVVLLLAKYVLGLTTMLKNQQTTIKILIEIAKKQGVSEDYLDGIINESYSNN